MTHEVRMRRGARVVVLGGDHLASLGDWVAEMARAVPSGEEESVGGLLVDFRAQGFAPSADEAGTLVESLRTRFHDAVPPLAAVARAGAQFGGMRVLCTLAEMRGWHACAFMTEVEAWFWLRAQLARQAWTAPPPQA
jgi:hypothetical protein